LLERKPAGSARARRIVLAGSVAAESARHASTKDAIKERVKGPLT